MHGAVTLAMESFLRYHLSHFNTHLDTSSRNVTLLTNRMMGCYTGHDTQTLSEDVGRDGCSPSFSQSLLKQCYIGKALERNLK